MKPIRLVYANLPNGLEIPEELKKSGNHSLASGAIRRKSFTKKTFRIWIRDVMTMQLPNGIVLLSDNLDQ